MQSICFSLLVGPCAVLSPLFRPQGVGSDCRPDIPAPGPLPAKSSDRHYKSCIFLFGFEIELRLLSSLRFSAFGPRTAFCDIFHRKTLYYQ